MLLLLDHLHTQFLVSFQYTDKSTVTNELIDDIVADIQKCRESCKKLDERLLIAVLLQQICLGWN